MSSVVAGRPQSNLNVESDPVAREASLLDRPRGGSLETDSDCMDNLQWKEIWKRLLARFEEEAGEPLGSSSISGRAAVDSWELKLLVRLLAEELPSCGKAGFSRRNTALRRLILHRSNSGVGMNLAACERQLEQAATRILTEDAAEAMLASAEQLEQRGDLYGARDAYAHALRLGPSKPQDTSMRFAHLLRVLDSGTVTGGSGAVRACEAELRRAIGTIILSTEKPLTAKRREVIGRLALLLCQEGREQEATPLLRIGGWRYRLADWILHYPPIQEESAEPSGMAPSSSDGLMDPLSSPLRVFDDALPPDMLRTLRDLLAPKSAFWLEHAYNEVRGSGENGYFSYLHSLSGPVASTIDLVIRHVFSLARVHFPLLAEATAAEWWAHCRPHPCGHQLHFDSDNEGIGGARHPICSCVIFVEAPLGIGGPTLVTDQRLGDDTLAAHGWLVYPRQSRIAVYDGRVLHGVVPGHGNQPVEACPNARRITWMVAFWRAITPRPFGADGLAGSNRPLPNLTAPSLAGSRSYTWHLKLALSASDLPAESVVTPAPTPILARPGVWVAISKPAGTHIDSDKPAELPLYTDCFQF